MNILYVSLQAINIEKYIKDTSFASFQTEDIEQYEQKHRSDTEFNKHISNNNWTDLDESEESDNNEEDEELKINNTNFEDTTTSNNNIEDIFNEELNNQTLIIDQSTNTSSTVEKNTKINDLKYNEYPLYEQISNNHNISQNEDNMIYIETDDISMKDKTPDEETVCDQKMLHFVKQLYENIQQMRNELQVNYQKICTGRDRTTKKRNNNRLTKNIINDILTLHDASSTFYKDIIQQHQWIENTYQKYEKQNKIDMETLSKIIIDDSKAIINDKNHNSKSINKQKKIKHNIVDNLDLNKIDITTKSTKSTEKNKRKRKADNKLPNRASKRRKK